MRHSMLGDPSLGPFKEGPHRPASFLSQALFDKMTQELGGLGLGHLAWGHCCGLTRWSFGR